VPNKGADKAQILAGAIEGAEGLMKATISAGIKKFIYTSSVVALLDRKHSLLCLFVRKMTVISK
jgi:hypothetical protein